METVLYRELAQTVEARLRCKRTMETHAEWFQKHTAQLAQLTDSWMPSGSGIDSGTSIDLDASHGGKLVFHTSFHHMNDGGFYNGWTDHTVTVTPSFAGFDIRISGRNRNDIKDHLHETFSAALMTSLVWNDVHGRYVLAS